MCRNFCVRRQFYYIARLLCCWQAAAAAVVIIHSFIHSFARTNRIACSFIMLVEWLKIALNWNSNECERVSRIKRRKIFVIRCHLEHILWQASRQHILITKQTFVRLLQHLYLLLVGAAAAADTDNTILYYIIIFCRSQKFRFFFHMCVMQWCRIVIDCG